MHLIAGLWKSKQIVFMDRATEGVCASHGIHHLMAMELQFAINTRKEKEWMQHIRYMIASHALEYTWIDRFYSVEVHGNGENIQLIISDPAFITSFCCCCNGQCVMRSNKTSICISRLMVPLLLVSCIDCTFFSDFLFVHTLNNWLF